MVIPSYQQAELGQWHMIFSILLHTFVFGIWQRLAWWMHEGNLQILNRKPITDYYERDAIIITLAALISGAILLKLGRKFAFFYLSLCQTIVLVIITCDSVSIFVEYYFNVTEGALLMVNACLIGEYIHPSYRTGIIFLQLSILYLGNAMSSLLKEYCTWEAIAGSCLFFQLMSIMCIGFTKDVKPFDSKRNTVEYAVIDNENSNKTQAKLHRITSIYSYLIKPVIIIVFGFLLSEASGRSTFAYINFLESILSDITYIYYRDLAFSLALIMSTIYLLKNGNLRSLILATGPTSVLILCIASIISFLKLSDSYVSHYLLTIHSVLAVCACAHLPMILMSEIVPMKYKPTSLLLSNIVGVIIIQMNTRSFPHLMLNFKLFVVLILSVIIAIICLLVLYFILPETKGKTLKDIEEQIVSRGVNMSSETMHRNQYV